MFWENHVVGRMSLQGLESNVTSGPVLHPISPVHKSTVLLEGK